MKEKPPKEPKRKHRYRHAEGKKWIEVRVKSAKQLFDARDPAPFRDRDLDDDFVEYVLSALRELSLSTPLKLVIYVDEVEPIDLPRSSIVEAIRSHFLYQVDLQRSELKNFMKRAQVFLVIGLLMLVSCLTVAHQIEVPDSPTTSSILREGIVIFGWVSIWKPIELILFDWYPLFEKLRFYKKMVATEMDLRFREVPHAN